MFTQSEYVAMRLNKDAYNRAYEEAETLRKLRQAGLIKPGRLTTLACKLLALIGHWMVQTGRRLERADAGSGLHPVDLPAV